MSRRSRMRQNPKESTFNCVLQCNNKPVRAVCYSPEKRTELQAVAASKSPVKLKNYKRASNDNQDVTSPNLQR